MGPMTVQGRVPAGAGLTDRERAILDFEHRPPTLALTKEEAIRERFGLSAPRYYQLLNALIDRQEALAADPVLVRRLRRLRARRREQREVG